LEIEMRHSLRHSAWAGFDYDSIAAVGILWSTLTTSEENILEKAQVVSIDTLVKFNENFRKRTKIAKNAKSDKNRPKWVV
jgi:hypothetical protein